MHGFAIGQSVLVEMRAQRGYGVFSEPHSRLVAKIGHKWVTLAGRRGASDRFCIIDDDEENRRGDAANDGPYRLDGGGYISPGRVWRDNAHREAYMAKEEAWKLVTSRARERSTMPAHLTAGELRDIAEMLREPYSG